MSTTTESTARWGESNLIPTFVGRQPIFDGNLEIRAYEILFRSSLENQARFEESDWATGQTFWNTFVELGLEAVAENQRVYLNGSRAFVLGGGMSLVPPDRVALEVRGRDEYMDEDFLGALCDLRSEGYSIVLDDFNGERTPAFDLATAVKIDVKDSGLDQAAALRAGLEDTEVLGIAQRIETFDEFEACRRAGFDVFQGHFLSQPQIVAGGRLPADNLTRIRLLSVINSPDLTIEKLEEVIGQDVALSYKLLNYVNSAMFALSSKVESIRHAIMILGQRWVKTWSNMVVLSGVADKPRAVFNTAVIRAKMCELLATASGERRTDTYFTVGLLSALDFLLDRPMSEILESLPLADDIVAALLDHEGELGESLACTLSYEKASWDGVGFGSLSEAEIRDAYIGALEWTADLRGALAAA